MTEDGFDHPRMNTYMKPEDLNTEDCLTLAEAVLQGAAEDYIHARRAAVAHPNSKDAQEHLRVCELFYRSDWFAALSGGVIDGKAAMEALDRQARGGGNRHK